MRAAPDSILIIEDVDTMGELLCEIARGLPGAARVIRAANGAEARSILLRNRPDWVILDEVLPGESAADLATLFATEGIPILLVTATPGADGRRAPLPSGCQARLAKPGWREIDAARAAWLPHWEAAQKTRAR